MQPKVKPLASQESTYLDMPQNKKSGESAELIPSTGQVIKKIVG